VHKINKKEKTKKQQKSKINKIIIKKAYMHKRRNTRSYTLAYTQRWGRIWRRSALSDNLGGLLGMPGGLLSSRPAIVQISVGG
jgi:hypothetical protein